MTEFDPLKTRVRILQLLVSPKQTNTKEQSTLNYRKLGQNLKTKTRAQNLKTFQNRFDGELQDLGEFFMGELSTGLEK